jgi:predicted DNA binding CopG/RHH family protein
MPKLDDFEKDILESVENDEWTSKDNLPKRAEELKGYLSNQKKKAISIRISENDLYLLKKKALESGLPYQNVIQMLIHQYTTDKIKVSV